MLSSKAKYALRALLRLVENTSAGSWIQTGEVAEQVGVGRRPAAVVPVPAKGVVDPVSRHHHPVVHHHRPRRIRRALRHHHHPLHEVGALRSRQCSML